jgi:hypothetical protein
MISHIGHVVINHQNQNRRNDIWGHVHYRNNNSVVILATRCWHDVHKVVDPNIINRNSGGTGEKNQEGSPKFSNLH